MLAADMHFDDFRLQTVKRHMWAELHRCLSFLKLSQVIQVQAVQGQPMHSNAYANISVYSNANAFSGSYSNAANSVVLG